MFRNFRSVWKSQIIRFTNITVIFLSLRLLSVKKVLSGIYCKLHKFTWFYKNGGRFNVKISLKTKKKNIEGNNVVVKKIKSVVFDEVKVKSSMTEKCINSFLRVPE